MFTVAFGGRWYGSLFGGAFLGVATLVLCDPAEDSPIPGIQNSATVSVIIIIASIMVSPPFTYLAGAISQCGMSCIRTANPGVCR